MKLKKIKFNSIRNFSNEVEFDFSDVSTVTTISGKNGTGKTTIFKSLVLCQKAFFITQLSLEESVLHINQLDDDFKKFFLKKGSFIEVSFKFDNELDFDYSFRVVCSSHSLESVRWELNCQPHVKDRIAEHWNFKNPSEIIVLVESDKHFFEKNVSHENISVKYRSNQLLIDTILAPEKLFSNIYQYLINDYLRQRLVPARPKTDIYFLPTKIFLQLLLPHVTIDRFSGQQTKDQFVLLAKTNDTSKISFDIRNFSSGEKTLFYILLFVNYVQKIGLLIIDEPENHFHEELLVKLVQLLKEICDQKDYVELIKYAAKKTKTPISDSTLTDLKKYYSNYDLSQVFLLTHSKNLVYNNFKSGANFYLDGGFKKLEYDSFEKKLRELGLSSIYSKVLFVEGPTETEFFDLFFNEYNIQTHSLNGCGAVIDTYNRIVEIKSYLKDYHFCFLIDRDTRSDENIENIRQKDTVFFDDHFMILDRHEIENYLLEKEIFYYVEEKDLSGYEESKMLTADEIEQKIKTIATGDKPIVIRKSLNKKNNDAIDKLKKELIKKDVKFDNQENYTNYLAELFSKAKIEDLLLTAFELNYSETMMQLGDTEWNLNWKKLCDGKIVLRKSIDYFANYLDIDKKRFETEMKNYILSPSTKLPINDIILSILKKFKVGRSI